ncbi:hypothetical protein [Nostoc sp.]|uniref:hypothetical protein n=1 Tax=Nostoc sp. TaxID=1180 RepID=UPI002FFCAAAC
MVGFGLHTTQIYKNVVNSPTVSETRYIASLYKSTERRLSGIGCEIYFIFSRSLDVKIGNVCFLFFPAIATCIYLSSHSLLLLSRSTYVLK